LFLNEARILKIIITLFSSSEKRFLSCEYYYQNRCFI
jgi:hypothetical protein